MSRDHTGSHGVGGRRTRPHGPGREGPAYPVSAMNGKGIASRGPRSGPWLDALCEEGRPAV
eukprot:3460244-Prymnesium_polylepis.1